MMFLRSLTPLGRVVGGLVLLAVLVGGFLFIRSLFIGDANVRADLGTAQADAAIASGKDAVEITSQNERRADDVRRAVSGVQADVQKTNDGGDADRAGRAGLCEQFDLCGQE